MNYSQVTCTADASRLRDIPPTALSTREPEPDIVVGSSCWIGEHVSTILLRHAFTAADKKKVFVTRWERKKGERE